MNKNLLARTADHINEAYKVAQASAAKAVERALEAGRLLNDVKRELAHGDFIPWIENNLSFSVRMAQLCMKAARMAAAGEAVSTIRQLLLPAPPKTRPKKNNDVRSKYEGVASHLPVDNSSGDSEPQAELLTPLSPSDAQRADAVLSDDWVPDEDEGAALDEAEQAWRTRVDEVLAADDRLATALAQTKQLTALVATLKQARDGYMDGKKSVTKLLIAEQSKVKRLRKELQLANDEIERLGGKAA